MLGSSCPPLNNVHNAPLALHLLQMNKLAHDASPSTASTASSASASIHCIAATDDAPSRNKHDFHVGEEERTALMMSMMSAVERENQTQRFANPSRFKNIRWALW